MVIQLWSPPLPIQGRRWGELQGSLGVSPTEDVGLSPRACGNQARLGEN